MYNVPQSEYLELTSNDYSALLQIFFTTLYTEFILHVFSIREATVPK